MSEETDDRQPAVDTEDPPAYETGTAVDIEVPDDEPPRPSPVDHVLSLFDYNELPATEHDLCKLYALLAQRMAGKLPMTPETTICLRKLLESRDEALRAWSQR